MPDPTAAILVIGDEILTGKTEERNAAFLVVELHRLGVRVRRIVVVGDDVEEIAPTVRELAARHDHLFTSGGVGPTHDDVTVAGVARAFDRQVVRSAALEAVVRAAAGAALAERHLRLADVPEGAELLPVEGQSWPVLAVGNVVLLPGVPHLFRRKFLGIAERFRSAPFHHRVATVSQDEALLAPVLDRIDAAFPAVAVGSYPELIGGRWRVRITLESKDAAVVEAAFRGLLEGLPGAEPG